MNLTKSFYEIINEYIIEIPIIQREYAQGRTTKKVSYIRKRFVRDLVNSVTKDREIHLGFIYGKIVGREKKALKESNRQVVTSILEAVRIYANNLELNINAKIDDVQSNSTGGTILKFIPLDGQQRLTTLYLLCWYLYFKGGRTNNLDWLHNFKYIHRKSALAFCNELADKKSIDTLKNKQKNNLNSNIKELIKNSNFYLKKWNKDTTVSGMLEMLLAIEKEFQVYSDFDFSKVDFEKLPFIFDFMDLDSLNQTDELYVKMNSRGKQLSDYEHFKSWLQEKHNNTDGPDWLKLFWKKLDTDWLNYFWRKTDVDFHGLDDFYYNYIKNLALMYCLANNTEVPFEKFKDLDNQIRNVETYDEKKISYIPLENYIIQWDNNGEKKEFFLFNMDTLRFIETSFNTLLYLEQDDNYDKLDLDRVICKPFVEDHITDFFLKKNTFTPSRWNTAFYYAFLVFINDRSDENFSKEGLQQWLRFTRNTIYNTYVQNPENFNSAVKQIQNLSAHKFNISDAVLNGDVENAFFDNSQFEEEKVKLGLLKDENWCEPIIQAENHLYFYGQIKFLLDFSKDGSNEYSLEDFIKYSDAVSTLYSEEIRLNPKKILERFLLCCDKFYLPEYKNDLIFCSGASGGLRVRNENWRLFFKGENANLLKDAVDKLEEKEISPRLLEDNINNFIKNENFNKSDYKYLFLKYPQAIEYCKETAIRKYSDNDIRLLKGFVLMAYH